ncbi:MarR family transcriptional regulator [Nocardia puris]|uniref:MarR family winged helix-turn-helix transcriptional regulator n=1 Tax=Nocardia puris TaxID=208602 RepID=UPI001893E42D|nr:MarR family transcriptional regulator [Nocardia puris]MBF6214723.1 MarR family transcriptional regulator [Nocardia puris]MBF6368803.1 MarR family transcriptional regulator [Nocardia puris]MBF6462383.1 MarR family transcriptional regulator [Nocardia puris]
MGVSGETAEGLIKELYLIGRAIRATLLHPEEGEMLPGGVGVLGTVEVRGPCRQVDLAGELCISASVLSRHVAELVAAGYLARDADPEDGRATLIHVTDAGRALLRRVRASRARGLQAALDGWSDEDAAAARDSVRELRNSLAAHAHRDAERPAATRNREV